MCNNCGDKSLCCSIAIRKLTRLHRHQIQSRMVDLLRKMAHFWKPSAHFNIPAVHIFDMQSPLRRTTTSGTRRTWCEYYLNASISTLPLTSVSLQFWAQHIQQPLAQNICSPQARLAGILAKVRSHWVHCIGIMTFALYFSLRGLCFDSRTQTLFWETARTVWV